MPGKARDAAGARNAAGTTKTNGARNAAGTTKTNGARNAAGTKVETGTRLPEAARRVAVAVAEAALPAAGRLPSGGEQVVHRLEKRMSEIGRHALAAYGALLVAFDNAVRPFAAGRKFSSLSREDADRLLSTWADSGLARRTTVLGVTAPVEIAYFDDPSIYEAFGSTWEHAAPTERPRWMDQVTLGSEIGDDVDVECDVVVVGTGAGGAVVAKELTDKGFAVLMLEEGDYYRRDVFTGRAVDAFRRFYRDSGATASIGNALIPIPIGRLVGGSTAINTGTCWRTPDWILESWASTNGLADLTPERMSGYFERVEHELRVDEANAKFLGGVATVVARGCDALGYSHRPLRRNAPDCDGRGVCDMGCPAGAKRSTDVSYVPSALQGGAQLYTGVRAVRVLTESGRATGIEARSLASGATIRIRAQATVLSCGALVTPAFLARQGLGRNLRHLGRNLTIHPATTISALFDEDIRGFDAIPQGYCVDQFHRDGILVMGASAPIDVGATQFAFSGKRKMELMDAYDRVASMGIMVSDAPSGAVRPGPAGRSIITYWLKNRENSLLHRGMVAMTRVFLAAGAKEVYPALHGHRSVTGRSGLRSLEGARPRPTDWLVTAFHPLGSCRMASSPRDGVVDPACQVFGIPGLYVIDGSVIPGSPWVNPQVTIMAFATRAADMLAGALEG